MPEIYQGLVDHRGRPIEKKRLTEEVAGPTVSGVRSPISGYPGDGLNPQRLAGILREADQGDPMRYLELAETIEERDLHYVGVLGTRKRQVSQLDITVEAASDSAQDVDTADMVRNWLARDELQFELFDILDAIGKAVSYTEIIWDTSAGQWEPKRLEWRDPRWFKPNRADLTEPMLIGENGALEELPAGKFITPVMKAKSGLPLRSGIARIAAWAWMFKAYSNRDWAIFIQTFGQPIRIGKYGPGASREEKDTLFRAVANIAGDCAAIIPDSMVIDFEHASNIGASAALYRERIDHLDQQVSKGVLGQTATTDAIAGGHAVGQEHRQVQEDIERADAKILSAVLNRDLVAPWVMLEKGPNVAPPRIRIGRADQKDIKETVSAIERLVPLGLKVPVYAVRDLVGLPEAQDGDEVLTPPAATPAPQPEQVPPLPALQQQGQLATVPSLDQLAQSAASLAAASEAALLDAIAEIVAAHDTAAAREAALRAKWPGLPLDDLKAMMTRALVLAELSGRVDAAG